jgi:hypothetical protein
MPGLGTASLKIYVALEPQDMRKSFQGLSELALVHLGGSLECDALFALSAPDLATASTRTPTLSSIDPNTGLCGFFACVSSRPFLPSPFSPQQHNCSTRE